MALSTTPVDINRGTTGLTLPADLSDEVFANAVQESAVMQLARNVEIPGRGVAIPVVTGDPVADFVAETAEKPVSNATFATKIMTPYKVAVIETFSNQFRRDFARLYDELVRRLPYALGKKIDATVLGGTAPGTGFDVLTGSTAVALGTDAYAGLIAAMQAVTASGGDLTGWALSPQGIAALMAATGSDKHPLFVNPIEGGISQILGAPIVKAPAAFKAGTPNVLGYAGDWSKAAFGHVGEIEIAFSDQATLNDGTNTINLWQRNMFAVRAEFEVGFVVADASAFAKITA